MPHQCLGCGAVFEDGSTDLLKGCPSCDGTRFFYTQEPLGDAERTELQERTSKDVRSMLEDVLKSGERRDLSGEIWSRDAWEKWVRMDPGDDPAAALQRALQEADEAVDHPETRNTSEPAAPRPELVQAHLDAVEEAAPPESTVPPAPKAPEEPVPEARPSTLNIVEPGQYEIDVQRLLDDSPVIVERDGSYLIHLPSVFAKAGGKKRR